MSLCENVGIDRSLWSRLVAGDLRIPRPKEAVDAAA
jgi:hypothetical protein